MVHIYDENLKYLIGLNYDYEDFKNNPSLYYPNWKMSYYATENKYEYPIIDTNNIIREMTREEKILNLGMEELLEDGEYLENDKLIVIEYDEKLGYLKRTWNKETHIWYEGATEEEITKHMGELATKLLYEVLAQGCEVTIQGEKHQQSLSDEKRKALTERISGFNLAKELGSPISHVAWPFRDDGTDTVVMTTDEFKQLALTCLDFGDKCYIAAELLKANKKINAKIEDFYKELSNVNEISLENL